MNDEREILVQTASRLMDDLCPPEAVRALDGRIWLPDLWTGLTEVGFTLVGIDESLGGTGGSIADSCALLEVAGAYAAPVPLAETCMLGGWVLAMADLPFPPGAVTLAPGHQHDELRLHRESGVWHLHCRVYRVPWASESDVVVVLARLDDRADAPLYAVAIPRELYEVESGSNLAGEPRDTVSFDGIIPRELVATAPDIVSGATLASRGALSRCALMAGAMTRILDVTTRYAKERQQFGRPIASFQAVQRHLVRIAEQAQAASTATVAAAQNSAAEIDLFDVAAAKTVAGEAATRVAAAAHQTHGGMGLTLEYELAQLTRRLWSWRDEYGDERYWGRVLGRHVASSGADSLWPRIAAGSIV